ncbi:MAG TPA: hypothetical protein VLH19_02105 [Patescibacteria group bacterium]|nr:hypothetical protein [Patescibacteria group bacterium]
MKSNSSFLILVAVIVLFAAATYVVVTFSHSTQSQNPIIGALQPTAEPSAPLTDAKTGDGKLKVSGTSAKQHDGGMKYTFSVTDISAKSTWTLYEATVAAGDSMAIPLNSWTPDNKVLFLEKTVGGVTDYLVFRGDAKPWPDGQQFLSVQDYWTTAGKNLTIRTATGWAGNDLLIIYTAKADGSRGPNFWFVTETHKFMQLAH